MIRKASEFTDKTILAVDGEVGKFKGFFFYDEDRSWKIRYLVVELSDWFKAQKMLVVPVTFASFDGAALTIQLTRDEICKCPDSSCCNQTAMQQKEQTERADNKAQLLSWQCGRSGTVLYPILTSLDELNSDKRWDRPLRSSNAITGYKINTDDGPAGKVLDLLIDDRFWIIRFLLVTPSETLGRETRMVSAYIVEKMNVAESTMFLECGSDYVMRCLIFDPALHINVSYEDFLKNYHVTAKTNNVLPL